MHPLNKLVHHHILGWLLVGRDDSQGSSAVQAAVTSRINMRRHPPISDKSSDYLWCLTPLWCGLNGMLAVPSEKSFEPNSILSHFGFRNLTTYLPQVEDLMMRLKFHQEKIKSNFWNIGGRYMHSKNLGLSRHWVNNLKMSGKNLLGGEMSFTEYNCPLFQQKS